MLTCGMVLLAIRRMSKEITLERCAGDLGLSVSTLQRWTGGPLLHSEGMPKGLGSAAIRRVLDQYQETIFGRDPEKTLLRFLGELEGQGVAVEGYRVLYETQGYERTLNEVLYAMTERKVTKPAEELLLPPEANREQRITRPVEGLGEAWAALREAPGDPPVGGGPVIAPGGINACGGSGLLETVTLRIRLPQAPFPVDYFLRHVQNGKNEFLPAGDWIPLNLDYPFRQETAEGDHAVTIPWATRRQGFQFKCYALCAREHGAALTAILQGHFRYDRAPFRHHVAGDPPWYTDDRGRDFPLVEVSGLDDRVVWFILPNYGVYVTEDPFLNNYFFI